MIRQHFLGTPRLTQDNDFIPVTLKKAETVDITTTGKSTFDPDAINERIMQGDLSALEELENEVTVTNFTSKETTVTKNGKTYSQIVVKYTYDGCKYNLICRKEIENNQAAEDVDNTNNDTEAPDNDVQGSDTVQPNVTDNDTTTPVFNTYGALRNYIFSNEARATVRSEGITDFSNGSYEKIAEVISKAHEKDFATVTKEQLIKEFIDEYKNATSTDKSEDSKDGGTKVDGTDKSDNSGTTASGFNTYNDLRGYIFGAEARAAVRSKGIVYYAKINYETIAETISKAHEKDFTTVTKEQLIAEFVAEYEKRVPEALPKPNNDTVDKSESDAPDTTSGGTTVNGTEEPDNNTTTSDFKTYNDLRGYIFGAEARAAVRSEGITDISDKSYAAIAETISKAHEKDFATVTKEQLIKEFIEEYKNATTNDTKAEQPAGGTGGGTTVDDADKTNNGTTTGNSAEAKANNDADNKVTLQDAYKEVGKTIDSISNWIGMKSAKLADKISLKFSISDGSMSFANVQTSVVYKNLIEKIYSEISNNNRENYLETIGGKDGLTKLVQNAWIMTYSTYDSKSTQNTEDFVDKVMENLQKMFSNLQANPDNLSYLTDNCYGDTSLKETSTTKINISNSRVAQYDKNYHLSDDNSDKTYQEAMDKLLEKLYNKYPTISKAKIKEIFVKAQGEALTTGATAADIFRRSTYDMPEGVSIDLKSETSIKDMVQLVLYKFDQLFKTECLNSTFPTREAETPANTTEAKGTLSSTESDTIKEGAKNVKIWVEDVADDIVSNAKDAIGMGGDGSIHTEFGMDSSGNIIFQDSNTTKVYNTILQKLKAKINRHASDALKNLGGDTVLQKLVQAAWITTYNDFDSSQSNNLTKFVNKVMSNLESMLTKIESNPEVLSTFTQRTSYADKDVTTGVKHYNTKTTYGNDETINYGGNVTTYADGSVHISNDQDDDDYQVTMNDVLNNLIKKYTKVDEKTIKSVFANAQQKALAALQGNRYDCPYGTGNNKGRVEDPKKDWGGKDNRKDDKNKIDMDELVQMTLYYFDKLLMKELLK